MNTFRLLLIALFILPLMACGQDGVTPNIKADISPSETKATSNIAGSINIVNFAEVSAAAFIQIKLIGSHKTTGEWFNYASTIQTNLNSSNFGFSIPRPTQIDSNINYGISIDLVSRNSHPGFAAWYPLDLNHYKDKLLSARLFLLNSSSLINYQISAFQCGTNTVEAASDNASMWLNIDGSGHFLNKVAENSFASDFVSFNTDNNTLLWGDTRYACDSNNKGSSLAKKRFSGATFYSLNRKDGWAITIYNNSLQLVSRRGLRTELKAITAEANLNGTWQINTTDGTVVIKHEGQSCADNSLAISGTIEGTAFSACGEKLR